MFLFMKIVSQFIEFAQKLLGRERSAPKSNFYKFSLAQVRDNPLINPPALPHGVPAFHLIKNEHFLPALRSGMALHKKEVAAILDNKEKPTFENTIEALEFAGRDLHRVNKIFSCFCSSKTNDELRAIETVAKEELASHNNDMSLDTAIFKRIKAVYDERASLSLSEEQATLLQRTYKGYVDGGALLPLEQQERFRTINKELSAVTTAFGQNAVKATEAYQRIVTDEKELAGVPQRAKDEFREQAEKKGLAQGSFLLLLEPYPDAVMTHCSNRALREEISRAYSECCFHDAFDNTGNNMKIAELSHEKAKMLGYETYADFVVSNRMVESVQEVKDFLGRNLTVYKEAAEIELKDLRDFAAEKQRANNEEVTELKPWDQAYYARMMKEEKFKFETEELRPYFDLEKVLEGLRQHAEKLFNIEFREETTGKYPVYHADVKTFEVCDKATGKQIGVFYGDYYARGGTKNSGAWMDALRDRGLVDGKDQIPIVTNSCNFPKPAAGNPTLLSIDDVLTVFHEFGHALHALLAMGNYPSQTGINVKWDFIEVMSQLMERWVCEPSVLAGFAHHHKDQKPIPAELVQKLNESNTFHAGLTGLRQTFLGLLDIAWYTTKPEDIGSPEALEGKVAEKAVLIKREAGLMSTSFTHIFGNGYEASYDTYKLNEVMAHDLFASAKEAGLYDRDMGARLRTMYASGGAIEPMKLFIAAKGRKPDPDALFRYEGLPLPQPGVQGSQTRTILHTPQNNGAA